MKVEILDLAVYIYRNYPYPTQLSKPRLVKIIYLIDWKCCIDYGEQATNINWYFNHYGPYVEDVINILKNAKEDFLVESYMNPFGGGISDSIKLLSNNNPTLIEEVKNITNLIISKTNKLNWTTFISLVYSTFPVQTSSKYTYLNLVEDAKKYKKNKK